MASSYNKAQIFWQHPLLHFLLLGLLIFAWDALRDKAPSQESLNIAVTSAEVERMSVLWGKTWGRRPTEDELQGLITDHVKEEIYYREAKRLGLDENDIVIRRRLRQKMEFLSSDAVASTTPEDTVLKDYYAQNQEQYQSGESLSLEHIYYDTDHQDKARQDLIALKAGGKSEALGDPISLPRQLNNANETDISRLFGSVFYKQLSAAPEGEWVGPLRSGFGLHLVRKSSVTPPTTLPFESVKERVASDWKAKAIEDSREKAFEELRTPYKINVQMPDA